MQQKKNINKTKSAQKLQETNYVPRGYGQKKAGIS